MATKSMEGYKTARLAQMGDVEAQQKLMSETPGFNMMDTQQAYSQPSKPIEQISKDREVEIGLGTSVGPNMSDEEKRAYVDSLTDAQYRQMNAYKNQGYSFEAARTLLENSDGLANPTAQGKAKYNPKGNFVSNVVGGAYDSVTGIPRMIAKWGADAVGWTAKQLGADEAKTDALVQDYKNYLDSDWSGQSIGANTDSWTYKGSKMVGDLAQTFAYGALGGNALQGTKLGQVSNTIKNSGLAGKMAVGAAEGAADMGIYSMVADSELPSAGDLALGGALGAAAPMLGAAYKGTKGLVKKNSVKIAEDIIGSMNKLTDAQKKNFLTNFGEKATKWMNDRGIKNGQDLIDYFNKSKGIVDNALGKIEGTFKSQEVTNILEGINSGGLKFEGIVKQATKTRNKEASRILELAEKNRNEGLTMSEINEVKRYFEKMFGNKYKPATWNQLGDSDKHQLMKNLDNELRERQRGIAEERGFTNLAELNKETQAARELMNSIKVDSEQRGKMTLEDWIYALESVKEGNLSLFVSKKVLESPRFKNKAVDILNWIGKHETIPEKIADLTEISKINKEKELEAWLKQQEQEYAEYLASKGVGDTTPRLNYSGPEVASDNRYWQKLRDTDPTVKYEVKEFDSNGKMFNDDPYNVPKDVVERKPTNPGQ